MINKIFYGNVYHKIYNCDKINLKIRVYKAFLNIFI